MTNCIYDSKSVFSIIDDGTNLPKSIVMLYEYKDGSDDLLGGRIVALYDEAGNLSETVKNPTKLATKVKGSPKYVGLDIIWDMKWDKDDNQYQDGKIMDPKKGSVYSSVIWKDHNDKLRVRGKIGPFGRTQTWNVLNVSGMPRTAPHPAAAYDYYQGCAYHLGRGFKSHVGLCRHV